MIRPAARYVLADEMRMCIVTGMVLQVVLDVLENKLAQGPVEIFLLAIKSLHMTVAYDFHILASAKAKREICARETFVVLPDIESV